MAETYGYIVQWSLALLSCHLSMLVGPYEPPDDSRPRPPLSLTPSLVPLSFPASPP